MTNGCTAGGQQEPYIYSMLDLDSSLLNIVSQYSSSKNLPDYLYIAPSIPDGKYMELVRITGRELVKPSTLIVIIDASFLQDCSEFICLTKDKLFVKVGDATLNYFQLGGLKQFGYSHEGLFFNDEFFPLPYAEGKDIEVIGELFNGFFSLLNAQDKIGDEESKPKNLDDSSSYHLMVGTQRWDEFSEAALSYAQNELMYAARKGCRLSEEQEYMLNLGFLLNSELFGLSSKMLQGDHLQYASLPQLLPSHCIAACVSLLNSKLGNHEEFLVVFSACTASYINGLLYASKERNEGSLYSDAFFFNLMKKSLLYRDNRSEFNAFISENFGDFIHNLAFKHAKYVIPKAVEHINRIADEEMKG